jgi:hypothetical protein
MEKTLEQQEQELLQSPDLDQQFDKLFDGTETSSQQKEISKDDSQQQDDATETDSSAEKHTDDSEK